MQHFSCTRQGHLWFTFTFTAELTSSQLRCAVSALPDVACAGAKDSKQIFGKKRSPKRKRTEARHRPAVVVIKPP